MSVVIVVKVSEGLVLAADSAATLSGIIEDPQGNKTEGILQTFYNSKKLLQVGENFPIGVLTWGQAFIGPRTIESLVREWEYDKHWQSIKIYKDNKKKSAKYKVKEYAQGLLDYFLKLHSDEYRDIPYDSRPGMGMVVAGYTEGEFFPEIWRFVVPQDSEVHNQRPDIDGKPNFGASWFGIKEPIVRLHFGRDERVINIISEKYGINQDELRQSLSPLQYLIPFAQMPLQDAIEYANYILNVVIGRFRFVIGPNLCGGEIDIAAITQRDFTWIKRKSWKLD